MGSQIITNDMDSGQGPTCKVTPLPSIGGERRSYHGLAQPFASHAHEHYVIGCVRKGRRTLNLNGVELPIGPNSLIVFNPGDVHGCVQEDESLFAYDSFTISEDALDGVNLQAPDSEETQERVRAVFDEAMHLLNDSLIEGAVERILFLATLLEADRKTAVAPPDDDVAAHVYAHLHDHLSNPISVAGLAAAEGVSEYALIRAYRKRFAITPLQHLTALRVDCACELLAQGLSPSVVAVETGFSDQAHLTRVFKQRIGTTPAAYERMAVRES